MKQKYVFWFSCGVVGYLFGAFVGTIRSLDATQYALLIGFFIVAYLLGYAHRFFSVK